MVRCREVVRNTPIIAFTGSCNEITAILALVSLVECGRPNNVFCPDLLWHFHMSADSPKQLVSLGNVHEHDTQSWDLLEKYLIAWQRITQAHLRIHHRQQHQKAGFSLRSRHGSQGQLWPWHVFALQRPLTKHQFTLTLPPCLLDPRRDQCATWSECWLHREWHHGHQSANGTDSASTRPLNLTLVTSNCHLDLWLLEAPGFALDNLCMQGVKRVERGLRRGG